MLLIMKKKRVKQSLIVISLISFFAQCSTTAKIPPNDHFDGQKFSNEVEIQKPNFWQIATHIMLGRNGQWPENLIKIPEKKDQAVTLAALPQTLRPKEVAITFINHATILIQTPELNILTDPVWSYRVGPWSWAGPARAVEPGIRFEDLVLP